MTEAETPLSPVFGSPVSSYVNTYTHNYCLPKHSAQEFPLIGPLPQRSRKRDSRTETDDDVQPLFQVRTPYLHLEPRMTKEDLPPGGRTGVRTSRHFDLSED